MIRFLKAQLMFLADPVLATDIETYLEQSIVLLDCCCGNDPCDVLKVLWNEKLKEVSSLWQKLQERKFLDGQRSSYMFDWALAVCFIPHAASSRYLCSALVPTILVLCFPFSLMLTGKKRSLVGKFLLTVMLAALTLFSLFSECCI